MRDVMTPLDEGFTIAPDESLLTALQRLARGQRRRLFVMRGRVLQGLVSRGSVSRVVELRTLVQEA